MVQHTAGMFMEAVDLLASLQLEIGLLLVAVCVHLAVTRRQKLAAPAATRLAQVAGGHNSSRLHKVNQQDVRRDFTQQKYNAYHDRIHAAAQRGWQEVWAILEEMTASGAAPTQVTALVVLRECMQQRASPRDLDRAVKFIDSLESEIDGVGLAHLVDACLKCNRLDLLAPRLQSQQSKASIQRTPTLTTHQYATLIRGLGALGDIKGAWDVWCSMQARRVAPSSVALSCMVEALVASGDVEAGWDLIREMQSDPEHKGVVNGAVYGSVLKGYSHQQKIDRVWSVYEEMLEANADFTIVTFNTLIDACARSDEMGRIPKLLEDMDRFDIKPDQISYGSILKGYCRATRMNEAFQLLETMKQTTDMKIDEVMYNTLIDGCSHQGLFERGIEVLEQMRGDGIPPTNYTLSVLVKLCTRSNRPEEAFRLATEISKEYKFQLNAHVYANLMHACTQRRNRCLPRALETFDRMVSEKVRPDSRTYTLLIRACIEDREDSKAEELVRYALGLPAHKSTLSPSAMRPAGKFPTEVVSEVLGALGGAGAELLRDIKAQIPDMKLEASLQMRCMEKALMNARGQCDKDVEQKPYRPTAAPWRKKAGTC